MRIRYGSYTHRAGTVEATVSQEPVRDEANNCYAIRTRWSLDITVCGADSTSVTKIDQTLRQIEAAYSQDGLDLAWILPTGKASVHALRSADCIGGTKVVSRPSYPKGSGAEFATYRTVRVVVQGDVAVAADDLRSNLISFSETVQTGGGGPKIGYLQTRVGLPVAQLLSRNTVYTARQSGRASGLYGYPLIPSPIWPTFLVARPEVSRESPRRDGDDYVGYQVSWTYQYQSAYPLSGRPNVWS